MFSKKRRILLMLAAVILLAGCADALQTAATPTPTPGPTPNLAGLAYYEKYRLMAEGQATVPAFLSSVTSNTDVAMAFVTLMTGEYDLAAQMVAEEASDTLSAAYLAANPSGVSEADLLIGDTYEHSDVYILIVKSATQGGEYAVCLSGKRVVAYFPLYATGLSEEIEAMRAEYQAYFFQTESPDPPGHDGED